MSTNATYTDTTAPGRKRTAPSRQQVSCTLCGKVFSQPWSLARHTAKSTPCVTAVPATGEIAPNQCKHCGRVLSKQCHLERHLTRCSLRARVAVAAVLPDPIDALVHDWLVALGFTGRDDRERVPRATFLNNMQQHAATFTAGFYVVSTHRPEWQLQEEHDCPVVAPGQTHRARAQINTILALAANLRVVKAGETHRLKGYVEIARLDECNAIIGGRK